MTRCLLNIVIVCIYFVDYSNQERGFTHIIFIVIALGFRGNLSKSVILIHRNLNSSWIFELGTTNYEYLWDYPPESPVLNVVNANDMKLYYRLAPEPY